MLPALEGNILFKRWDRLTRGVPARRPAMSIAKVLVGLGGLSVAVALCLAAFGIGGTRRQAAALERVMLLERALHNHTEADAFMDNIRDDVLRALQSALATNKEGDAVIRAALQHHIEVIETAVAENHALPLDAALRRQYADIGRQVAAVAAAGRVAVDLALANPVSGSTNYETFRSSFSGLEAEMDAVRDRLDASLGEIRALNAATTALVQRVILAAAGTGILFLLAVSLAAILITKRITTDLACSREQARHAALHDSLTGLPNRRLLAERLGLALAQTRRRDSSLAVLSLDLDRFKQVNDTLGHHAGDALLRIVADRLRDCLRERDTVARLGGDEFAIIQASVEGGQDAVALSMRLVESLSAPYDIGGHQVVIGASVGFALAPDDALEAEELLKMADIALYRAKGDGRGTFRSFESGMDAKLQARRLLELDLRQAVAADRFELHYQPLVNLASGQVTVFEALLRWNHPWRGQVAPNDFVPLAEETGLIVPLGGWVLRQACLAAAGWPETVRVAVNLSAAQFKTNGLVATVAEALAGSGLRPDRLELEITESVLLHDTHAALAILNELRAIGVRIAMDDFGTGYSSLGYLRSFPFDKIKIDQCFVRDIGSNEDCRAIVRAVTGLGLSLGIATTAEGVETWEQLDRVRAEGCQEVQGYFFSRPVPADEVLAVLNRVDETVTNAPANDAVASHTEHHLVVS